MSSAKVLSMREHILKKSMWGGTISRVEEELNTITENFTYQKRKLLHSPIILKIFDEVITNAVDHVHTCKNERRVKDRVTDISILYNGYTFMCRNNGKGIKFDNMHTENGDLPRPQVLFSVFLSGTNFDDDQQNMRGGTNGLGVKLTNVHSNEFKN